LAYVIKVLAEDGGSAAGCGLPGREVKFEVGGQMMATDAAWDNDQVTRWELGLDPSDWHQRIYLPLVLRNYVVAPDLVVQSVSVSGSNIQVVIKNQGLAAVEAKFENEFWVDLYVNPLTPPTAVNQTRETLGCAGAVWGVTTAALPQLSAGGTLTLTLNDAYYDPARSDLGTILPGTPIYVQVDSANVATTYGAVLENHEMLGEAYNQ
jgi:hypothetical protein